MRAPYGGVRTATRYTGVGLIYKARDVIRFDQFLDNPLVDDAVGKGERHDTARLGVVDVKVVIRAGCVGVLAERGVNATEAQQF